MDFDEIIAAATGGFVTFIAGYVGRRITLWLERKEKEESARADLLGQLTEDITALREDLASVQIKMAANEEQLNIMQDGMLALSRDRIVQSELHFLKEGEVPMQVKENLNQMCIAYHKMGGNGVVTEIHDRFMDLPTTL